MRTLAENTNQAILDFDGIKEAIIGKGVAIPDGTPTREYKDKINQIETGSEFPVETMQAVAGEKLVKSERVYVMAGSSKESMNKMDNPSMLPTGMGCAIALCTFNNTLYMAVGHRSSPYVSTYYLSGTTWVKMTNLIFDFDLGGNSANGVSFCVFNDILYLAVGHYVTPYVSTYYLSETAWVKMDNPSIPINTVANSVTLCEHSNILYMAVGYIQSPYVSTYYLSGTAWIKMDNPSSSPAGETLAIALCTYNNVLYMAVGHYVTPFISTYYLSGTAWVKISNPLLPPSTVRGVFFCVFHGILYMAAAHYVTPFISTYYLSGTAWVKMDNPNVLPSIMGAGVSMIEFDDTLYMAVGQSGSPYVSTYYQSGTAWVKMGEPDILPNSFASGIALQENNGILYMAASVGESPFVVSYKLETKSFDAMAYVFENISKIPSDAISLGFSQNNATTGETVTVDVLFK